MLRKIRLWVGLLLVTATFSVSVVADDVAAFDRAEGSQAPDIIQSVEELLAVYNESENIIGILVPDAS